MVPAFLYMDLVGIGFLGLFASSADDVALHPVIYTVVVSVILPVELFHAVSRPSRISF